MTPFSSSPRGAVPFSKLGAAPRARLRRLGMLCAGIAVGVWLWQWISTDEKGDPIVASDEPALEIEGLKSFLVRRTDGSPLWEISARRVALANDNSSTQLSGVERGTLFRGGKPFLHLSAPAVHLTNASSDLAASGGVSAVGPDGFSFQTRRTLWHNQGQSVECPDAVTAWLRGLWFQTPRLFYGWDKGVLTCPQPVEVRGQGVILRGHNLEATLKTREIKMSGVEIIIAPNAAHIDLPRLRPRASKDAPKAAQNN